MHRLVGLLCLIATMLPFGPRLAAAQAVVQDIGGMQLLYSGPANPRAIAFVFAGGDGTVAFNAAGQISHMGANFLFRTQSLWLAQGLGYATLGSTSSLRGQRHTPAYAQIIGRAIDALRARANAPVWLIGTSQGAIAAANGAAHLPGRVAGVVLTSAVAGRSASGETVYDSDLGAIAVPALVVANRGDTCPSAGPGFAPQILAALARSPRKDIIYVESHQQRSEPCEATSPHGYLGIEGDVVQRIAGWIGSAPGR
ncbi:MAG TPA: alpha/beta hydrolase [Stellaceae bacterium]|nr:alpha/beta hydrolase [Stellaceae bacterium]